MKKEIALIAVLALGFIPTAIADETGLASLHAQKHEKGRRICMVDHFHDGAGKGKTKKEAEKAAKRSWIDFTAFEYGTNWGSYKLAVSKEMNCNKLATQWSCMASARPCKRYVKPAKKISKSASVN